jgi:hypothetical protein
MDTSAVMQKLLDDNGLTFISEECAAAVAVLREKKVDEQDVCLFVNCHKLLEKGNSYKAAVTIMAHMAEEHEILIAAEAVLKLTECIAQSRDHVRLTCQKHGVEKMFREGFVEEAVDHNLISARAIYNILKAKLDLKANLERN